MALRSGSNRDGRSPDNSHHDTHIAPKSAGSFATTQTAARLSSAACSAATSDRLASSPSGDCFLRRDHLNVERFKVGIQRVRVVRLIADQSFRLLISEAFNESFSEKGDFMRTLGAGPGPAPTFL
jgi:hypothetical protein